MGEGEEGVEGVEGNKLKKPGIKLTPGFLIWNQNFTIFNLKLDHLRCFHCRLWLWLEHEQGVNYIAADVCHHIQE